MSNDTIWLQHHTKVEKLSFILRVGHISRKMLLSFQWLETKVFFIFFLGSCNWLAWVCLPSSYPTVMFCNPCSGLTCSKAPLAAPLGPERAWKVPWLACSPAAGQYFQRLWGCSACLEICLHSCCHPKSRGLSSASSQPFSPICS